MAFSITIEKRGDGGELFLDVLPTNPEGVVRTAVLKPRGLWEEAAPQERLCLARAELINLRDELDRVLNGC